MTTVSTTPIPHATITLRRPMSGLEIMSAVHQVVAGRSLGRYRYMQISEGTHGAEVPPESFVIGQGSTHDIMNILVSPGVDDYSIDPTEMYNEMIISPIEWGLPDTKSENSGLSQSGVIGAFAARLEDQLLDLALRDSYGPEHSWPQSLTVCAVCELELEVNTFGDPVCNRHGLNPLSKKMFVVPTK